MAPLLPVDIATLLRGSAIESARLEFKESWDPKTAGPQVLKTICAFANDYYEVNGGYLVLGVGEQDSRPVLPPRGLSPAVLSAARKWIRGKCRTFDPPYVPILSAETFEGRHLLVVHAPASELRPIRGPSLPGHPARYWIRVGAETVDAEQKGDSLRPLIELTARVPWDDRPARDNRIEDLSGMRVREHLRAAESATNPNVSDFDLYHRLHITTRVNEHEVPRNVGLLLFSIDPTEWFPGAHIEVAQFYGAPVGQVLEERIFGGGIVDQIRDCQSYLERQLTTHLDRDGKSIATPRWKAYPSVAIRELLVNAVVHRAYGPDEPDPIRVYVYPDRLTVTSYPGPVPGLEPKDFLDGARRPATRARNRRIVEFLRAVRLAEGRLTGVDLIHEVMKANGSPPPEFTFDEGRTYFAATLPAHPDYLPIGAVREAAHLEYLGKFDEAESRLDAALDAKPGSGPLAGAQLRLRALRGDRNGLEEARRRFLDAAPDADEVSKATALLRQTLKSLTSDPGPDRGLTRSEPATGD